VGLLSTRSITRYCSIFLSSSAIFSKRFATSACELSMTVCSTSGSDGKSVPAAVASKSAPPSIASI